MHKLSAISPLQALPPFLWIELSGVYLRVNAAASSKMRIYVSCTHPLMFHHREDTWALLST